MLIFPEMALKMSKNHNFLAEKCQKAPNFASLFQKSAISYQQFDCSTSLRIIIFIFHLMCSLLKQSTRTLRYTYAKDCNKNFSCLKQEKFFSCSCQGTNSQPSVFKADALLIQLRRPAKMRGRKLNL